ncbi:MAG: hypothetical protein ABFE13_16785 [Phycisphaerales bacterium]
MHHEASHLVQDGPKEVLLCDPCEQRISRNEKYFKEAIHLSRHNTKVLHNRQVAIIQGLDYSKAKLFLLSLIYRMSVSSLRQFGQISLGTHEGVLGDMIITEDPGRNDQYAITAMIPLIGGNMEECFLCTLPVSHRNGVTVCPMIVAGILYTFFIPGLSNRLHDIIALNTCLDQKWVLNESGEWIVPLIDFLDIPSVKAFLERRINNQNHSQEHL